MVGDLIRLKLTLTRHSTTGARALWVVCGAMIGVLLAAGVVTLSAWPLQPASLVPDLLAVAYLTWLVGWVVGPVMAPAPPLRPAHLAMLPVSRQRLARGLLVAGFVGVTTAVTALLFVSLIVFAARQGVVSAFVSVPLAVLQVVLLVLCSRVAHVAFGRLARARSGAALNGVLLAVVLVLSQSGWMLLVGLQASGVLDDGFPDTISAALRVAPSGWALAGVEAVAAGSWPRFALILLGMLLAGAALLAMWANSLGEPRGSRAIVRGSARRPTPRHFPFGGPTGTIVLKELRAWWRDPARTASLVAPAAFGLLTALLPLTFGAVEALPWAGTLIAVMAATWMANLYAFDGTGIWLIVQTGTARWDVRARQWAFLLVYGPLSLLVTVIGTAWSGLDWAWPWALAAVTAALGGGAGLIAFSSVALASPGPDALERAENPADGSEEMGPAFLVFFGALLPPAPGLLVVYLGHAQGSPALVWLGVLVGVAVGWLFTWGLGRWAAGRLERTAPDLLLLMRAGRATTVAGTGAAALVGGADSVATAAAGDSADGDEAAAPRGGRSQTQWQPLTGWPAVLEGIGWILGPVATIPQGLLPLVFKTFGLEARSWFLAMYLPGGWGWLTAIAMMLLGVCLMLFALRVRRHATREAPAGGPAEGSLAGTTATD